MSTTKALWEESISKMRKFLPSLPKSHGKRVKCLGNCGRMVTKEMGECRKCRRARIHKGLKFVKKATKGLSND
mgnify:FL=1